MLEAHKAAVLVAYILRKYSALRVKIPHILNVQSMYLFPCLYFIL
jgi:hypothetical protein